jgi:hypothetical protein
MMGVIAGMAQSGGFMAHGTYIPEASSAVLDLDTGVSGWTRFLMARKQMPNENKTARGFVLMYIDTNTDLRLCTFNSSAGAQYPNQSTAGTLGENVNKNGSVVVKRGIASQTGTLEAGIEYEWWCW